MVRITHITCAHIGMVMQGVNGAPKLYSNFFDVWRQAWNKEGVRGLYRGLVPSIIKSVPAHCITFVTYEALKKKFGVTKSHKH